MTACVVVESLEFKESEIKQVQAGLPAHLTPDVCFSCLPEENADIIKNCSVNRWKVYDSGQLEIGISKSGGFLDVVTNSFRERAENPFTYEGYGDVVSNNGTISAFLFTPLSYPDNQTTINYIEYNAQNHLPALRSEANQAAGTVVWGFTTTPVWVYNITCEKNQLSADSFAYAARMYRTGQIENQIVPPIFNASTNRFNKEVSPEALYRAVLTAKAVDSMLESGTFLVYTECGQYRWKFLMPLILCVFLFLLLAGISQVCKARACSSGSQHIGYRDWNLRARILQQETMPAPANILGAQDAYRRIFDQAVLWEDGVSLRRMEQPKLNTDTYVV